MPFFSKVDAIIYESQAKSFDQAIVQIMESGNMMSDTGETLAKEGERPASIDKGFDDEEASNDDEWHIAEIQLADDCQSSGSEKFINALNYLRIEADFDLDGYEPCLKDEWFIYDFDSKINFEVSSFLRGKFFEYNEDGIVSFEVRLIFYDKSHFIEVIKDFVIFNGFDMFKFKHVRHRFTALCSNDKECH
ncbi:hypothetical protein Ancab_014986 [Ancistrocladus abbreviatus]